MTFRQFYHAIVFSLIFSYYKFTFQWKFYVLPFKRNKDWMTQARESASYINHPLNREFETQAILRFNKLIKLFVRHFLGSRYTLGEKYIISGDKIYTYIINPVLSELTQCFEQEHERKQIARWSLFVTLGLFELIDWKATSQVIYPKGANGHPDKNNPTLAFLKIIHNPVRIHDV